MSYTRLTWVESETPLSAQNMNNIEDGIEELQSQKVDKVSGMGLSTNDYTTEEKTKLAGIEEGAEVNPDDFVGATASAAGVHGLVPAPTSTDFLTKKLLVADGSWRDLTFRDTNSNGILQSIGVANNSLAFNLRDAATTRSGLMSASDKTKLDGIAAGAQVNRSIATVEHTLSSNVTVYANDYSMLQFSGSTSAYSYRAISSIKLMDTSQSVAGLCVMNVETFSNGVRVYAYNPTDSSISVSKNDSYVNVLCISV